MHVISYDEQEVDDDKEEVKQDETAGSLVPKYTNTDVSYSSRAQG